MRITWRELAVDLSGQKTDDLLFEWRWLGLEDMSLQMVSTLGDAFLQDALGSIYWLNTGGAELNRIADSMDRFDAMRQQPEHTDEWFVPQLVGDLLSSGYNLEPDQCFSYKVPLTLGGEFQLGNFEPCNLSVHFHTLGQIQSQIKDMPVGTPISSVKLRE
jgi:hypothetical protein